MAMTDLIPWKKTNDSPALARWDFDPLRQLRQEIDQMFNGMLADWTSVVDSTGRMNLPDRKLGSWMPNIDLNETEKEIRVTAELPGIEEKDLEVALLDGALMIKGEKREEYEEEKGDVYRSECQCGIFERTIPLPSEVD